MERKVEMRDIGNESYIQRAYYKDTARLYDAQHVKENDEHYLALIILDAIIDFYNITSILDVGAGTGRAGRYLKSKHPTLKVLSIEPVSELREIGYASGLTKEDLIEGDVYDLAFMDSEFDLVTEFGVLHHVRYPARAVNEMIRVAKKGIYISDSNNFGQGSFLTRTIKQTINMFKLWRFADFVKTNGKGYTISEGDGLAYSYSVFNNYKQIRRKCHTLIFNTVPAGINPYKTAAHVALLGIKK